MKIDGISFRATSRSPPPSRRCRTRTGSYLVGFLAAIATLVLAYAMPAQRGGFINGAGTIAVLTFLFSAEKHWSYRLLGMLGAGVAVVAAIFMPDQAEELLSAAGIIAVLSLIFA